MQKGLLQPNFLFSLHILEGKSLAGVYSCGYYEVSIALNHRVNELLVGLVSAIKSANQRVDEERQRLSRIASIKANTGPSLEGESRPTQECCFNEKARGRRRYPRLGKTIRRFFSKHFSMNGA